MLTPRTGSSSPASKIIMYRPTRSGPSHPPRRFVKLLQGGLARRFALLLSSNARSNRRTKGFAAINRRRKSRDSFRSQPPFPCKYWAASHLLPKTTRHASSERGSSLPESTISGRWRLYDRPRRKRFRRSQTQITQSALRGTHRRTLESILSAPSSVVSQALWADELREPARLEFHTVRRGPLSRSV